MAKNFNVDDYIKDLSPELQDKARACRNMDELMDLAGEEGVELSDEALSKVAGGCGSSSTCNHSGQEGHVMNAEKAGAGGAMGETKWKILSAKCDKCGGEVRATKDYYVTLPDSWSVYTKKIRINDIV